MNEEKELAGLIGAWIRKARTDAGLSGDMLALKMTLLMGDDSKGNTKGNISHWEKAKHNPSLRQLMAIVKITGESLPQEIIDALTGGKLPEKSQSPVTDGELSGNEAGRDMPVRLAEASSAKIIGLPKTQHTVSGDVLAAIGFLTDREGQVINKFRMLTDSSRGLIEIGLETMSKEANLTVVDDKSKVIGSARPRANGSDSN